MSEVDRPAFSGVVEQALFEVRGDAFVRSVNESELATNLAAIEDEETRRRAQRCHRVARAYDRFLERARS